MKFVFALIFMFGMQTQKFVLITIEDTCHAKNYLSFVLSYEGDLTVLKEHVKRSIKEGNLQAKVNCPNQCRVIIDAYSSQKTADFSRTQTVDFIMADGFTYVDEYK